MAVGVSMALPVIMAMTMIMIMTVFCRKFLRRSIFGMEYSNETLTMKK